VVAKGREQRGLGVVEFGATHYESVLVSYVVSPTQASPFTV
jgi:hypothetical protein